MTDSDSDESLIELLKLPLVQGDLIIISIHNVTEKIWKVNLKLEFRPGRDSKEIEESINELENQKIA